MNLIRRFAVGGVFWRQYLGWAVRNVPFFYEPFLMAGSSFFFLVFAGPARRGVMHNLSLILPGSTALGNIFRALRIFWNFAWTLSEAARFEQMHVAMDWEFEGIENLDRLVSTEGGAIVITAHMGNYDLGSHVFAERTGRRLTTVRVPENDPDTQRFVEASRERAGSETVSVGYNVAADALAIDLVASLDNGDIVAIQGDRVPPGASSARTRLFGIDSVLPAGPFVLALVTGRPIYPLFLIRIGRRRYRVLTGSPIECVRTGRDRQRDIEKALEEWSRMLESTVREHWYQWYMFDPIPEAPKG